MPNKIELPPVFDPQLYRNLNPNLEILEDAFALNHFCEAGIAEGLTGSIGMHRTHFLPFLKSESTILEIGPFNTPAVSGDHVEYIDAFDSEQMRHRAAAYGLDPSEIPNKIHYVASSIGDASISHRFAAVFGSHSIEHQPDFIRHLQGAGKVLDEDGRYYIICPDKRFCFDHFLPETTIVDISESYREKRRIHSPRSFIAQRLLTTHNDPVRHWSGDHGLPRYLVESDCIKGIFLDLERNEYIDNHAWQFTPCSFVTLTTMLFDMGLSPLYPERVYHTPRNAFEFCAVLRKGPKKRGTDKNFIAPNHYGSGKKQIEFIEKLKNLRNENMTLLQEITESRLRINEVLGSSSWAITSPIRRVVQAFRRIK